MKNSYIGQGWLVLILSLSFGAALAGVETWLRPIIEDNKLNATIREIPEVVPGADPNASGQSARKDPLVVTVGSGPDETRYDVYRAIGYDGKQIGWVVRAGGKGFADRIELLIGLDARAETITGLSVLEQKETPGLGNKIEDMGTKESQGFLWAFRWHKPRADRPLTVTTASPKEDQPGARNLIKAVAGATISSKSVCNIINEALSPELRRKLVTALTPEAATQTAPARE